MTIRTATIPTPKRSTLEQANFRLVSRGWDALVKEMGYADATCFVMLLNQGSGDSVKYFRELWKDASAKEIYQKMMARRQQVGNK
jgi:hypothetical protein